MNQQSIAIFASGAGSNAQKIIQHFARHPNIKVVLVVCNKPQAGVLAIAETAGIPSLLIQKTALQAHGYREELQAAGVDFIVLAGFLLKIPPVLVQAFPNKIINIHPALLPKHGGQGMYGAHVHQAVIDAKDAQSGITIHYVNEQYDEGNIIFQASCPVVPGDDAPSLADKVHQLEHLHYPRLIEQLLN
jgi:phosphoribosylglycinamide formyltransferase 1